jgi:hypothetical protein
MSLFSDDIPVIDLRNLSEVSRGYLENLTHPERWTQQIQDTYDTMKSILRQMGEYVLDINVPQALERMAVQYPKMYAEEVFEENLRKMLNEPGQPLYALQKLKTPSYLSVSYQIDAEDAKKDFLQIDVEGKTYYWYKNPDAGYRR